MRPGCDILSIGHLDAGVLNYLGEVSRFTGGAVFFSSIAAARSGARAAVLTKLARSEEALLEPMRAEGVALYPIFGERTTSVENIFDSPDPDRRRVRLLSQAEPFSLGDLPPLQAGIHHLAGLFQGEIPDDFIRGLSARGATLALDLQAILRRETPEGFAWADWEAKRELLPALRFLKADSLEAEAITGSPDREEAARILWDWGAAEVLISHSSELIAFEGESLHRAPLSPRNLSGRTGRGDTAFAAYLARRLRHGARDSLLYAAALTSIKLESPGPFRGSVKEVEERMERDWRG